MNLLQETVRFLQNTFEMAPTKRHLRSIVCRTLSINETAIETAEGLIARNMSAFQIAQKRQGVYIACIYIYIYIILRSVNTTHGNHPILFHA
jgi:hypothetical protein